MRSKEELRELIEDMLVDQISEDEIKERMQYLGLTYTEDKLLRWKFLLNELENPMEELIYE